MQRDSAGEVMMMISNSFPVELHHQILCFMDPEDILALRKTSKYFLALTHEPRLWTTVYHRMRQTHPLSCSQSEFAALAPWQHERLLVRASKTEKLFQTFREHAQHRIFPDGQTRKIGPLVALSFLSERFLLSVDDTTVVYVWDISKLGSEAPTFPCARLTLVGWDFVTYSMSIDHSTLYVVLVKGARAHIFSLSLPLDTSDTDQPKLSFRDVAYLDTNFTLIKSIDVESCLILMQLSETIIVVVDWRTETRSTIPLRQETTEASPRNYILALRICGPYILCFRWWSVDAYPIPHQFLKPELAPEQPLPVLQHTIPGMAFSPRLSLSRVRHSHSPSGDVYTLYTLAENLRRGKMFYHQVQVHTTPVPSLFVELVGVEGAHAGWRTSAWDLGTTGLRGAKVSMPNPSGERHVVAFTTYPRASWSPLEPFPLPLPSGGSGDGGTLDVRPETEVGPRLGEQMVAIVSSKHSDDDVTKCAVSEFTGRIALGSRTGAITVI